MYTNSEKQESMSSRKRSGRLNIIGAILFGMFFVLLMLGQFVLAFISIITSLVLLISGSILSNNSQSRDWTNLIIDKEKNTNRKCPKCNYWNNDLDNFCANCGESLKKICKRCQTPNTIDAIFCNKCGGRL